MECALLLPWHFFVLTKTCFSCRLGFRFGSIVIRSMTSNRNKCVVVVGTIALWSKFFSVARSILGRAFRCRKHPFLFFSASFPFHDAVELTAWAVSRVALVRSILKLNLIKSLVVFCARNSFRVSSHRLTLFSITFFLSFTLLLSYYCKTIFVWILCSFIVFDDFHDRRRAKRRTFNIIKIWLMRTGFSRRLSLKYTRRHPCRPQKRKWRKMHAREEYHRPVDAFLKITSARLYYISFIFRTFGWCTFTCA